MDGGAFVHQGLLGCPYTGREVLCIEDYCRRRHIELVPFVQLDACLDDALRSSRLVHAAAMTRAQGSSTSSVLSRIAKAEAADETSTAATASAVRANLACSAALCRALPHYRSSSHVALGALDSAMANAAAMVKGEREQARLAELEAGNASRSSDGGDDLSRRLSGGSFGHDSEASSAMSVSLATERLMMSAAPKARVAGGGGDDGGADAEAATVRSTVESAAYAWADAVRVASDACYSFDRA